MSKQNLEVAQIGGTTTSSGSMTPEHTYYGSAHKEFWAEVIPVDMQQGAGEIFQEDTDLKALVIDPSELEIGKLIAEGGQASVFLAVWKPHATPVTIKKFNGCDVLRLRRQLQKIMRLPLSDAQSRYLCKVLGVFEDENGVSIVMERMAGDLRNVINARMVAFKDAKMPFPYGSSLLLMYSISLGVLALHNNGIVHKDLKASNILVVPNKDWMKSEEEGLIAAFEWCNLSIKIGDYESSEDVLGTGFWRAPEVLPGSEPVWTQKADVYSFAMVCYEILTGRIPFEGEKRTNYELVLSGQRPELPACVSKELKDLLKKCWHTDPEMRPNFWVIASRLLYIFANEYGLELNKYRLECIEKYEDPQLQVHLNKISNAKSLLHMFQGDMHELPLMVGNS